MSWSTDDQEGMPIDSAIEHELLLGLMPVHPDPLAQLRMLDNIVERMRKEPPKTFVTVRSVDGEWEEINPNIYRKNLISNGSLHACLYRLEPGSVFPAHDHPSDEECVCLEGEVSLGGIIIRAGEFHLAPQGLPHGEITTATGCLLYVRSAGAETTGER